MHQGLSLLFRAVLVAGALLAAPPGSLAQCTNNTSTGGSAAPAPGTTVTVTTTMRAGRYAPVTGAVAGRTYRTTSSITSDFITIRQGAYNGAVVAFGTQPLDWTAPANATYYIHCNTNASCGTNNTNRTFQLTCLDMGYSSGTTVQASTADAVKCNLAGHEILRVQVVTAGSLNPISLTRLTLRTNGSTAPTADIAGIKVYYTGTTATFSTANLFGNAAPAATGTNILVNGSQQLATGTNYFWVAYDLNAAATVNNKLDGQCTSLVVDGANQTPSATNPAGDRTIKKCPVYPGGVSNGILLWLRPDAGVTTSGVNVTAWTDQSTTETGTTVNGSPDLVNAGRNYNPVIKFTKSTGQGNDYVRLPSLEVQSLFLAAQLEDLTRNCTHIATWDRVTYAEPCTGCALHGGRDVAGGPATYGEAGYGRSKFQTAGVWRRNGDPAGITYDTGHSGNFDLVTALGTGTAAVNRALGGQVDNTSGFNGRYRDWLGPVGELILFGGPITTAEANRVESYLAIKYGITLGGNGSSTLAYRSSSGTVIWPANSGHHRNVIGIGRDDVSELLQKQSRSADDSTRIFLGALAASNQANTGTFANDKAFVMVGQDAGRSCASNASLAEQPANVYSRLEREWMVVNTAFTGTFTLSLKLNPCAMPAFVNPADLRLLVSLDGDFSNADVHAAGGGLSFTYAANTVTVSGISNAQIPANGTRYLTIGSAAMTTPLPIQLVSFGGHCADGRVVLNWTTASERDNASFTVEAGRDGLSFLPVATLPGAGTTSEMQAYAWSGPLPAGTGYYRLRQDDRDGRYTYSDVVAVPCTGGGGLVLYPNPAHGSVHFNLPRADGGSPLRVELRDVAGRPLQAMELAPSAQEMAGEIPLHGLPPGVYFVTYAYGGQAGTLKLLVDGEPH